MFPSCPSCEMNFKMWFPSFSLFLFPWLYCRMIPPEPQALVRYVYTYCIRICLHCVHNVWINNQGISICDYNYTWLLSSPSPSAGHWLRAGGSWREACACPRFQTHLWRARQLQGPAVLEPALLVCEPRERAGGHWILDRRTGQLRSRAGETRSVVVKLRDYVQFNPLFSCF